MNEVRWRPQPAFVLALLALVLAFVAMLFAIRGSGGGGTPRLGSFDLTSGGQRVFPFAGTVAPGHTHTVAHVGPFLVQFTCNDGGSSGQAGWRIKNVGKNNSWGDGDDSSDPNFDIGESDVEANNDNDSGDGMGAISPNGYAVAVDTEVSRDANVSGEPMTNNGCIGAAAVMSVGKTG